MSVQREKRRRLPHPVRDLDGKTITTIEEAKRYTLAMLKRRSPSQAWRHAAKLLVEGASAADIARQIELALLLDCRLDCRHANAKPRRVG